MISATYQDIAILGECFYRVRNYLVTATSISASYTSFISATLNATGEPRSAPYEFAWTSPVVYGQSFVPEDICLFKSAYKYKVSDLGTFLSAASPSAIVLSSTTFSIDGNAIMPYKEGGTSVLFEMVCGADRNFGRITPVDRWAITPTVNLTGELQLSALHASLSPLVTCAGVLDYDTGSAIIYWPVSDLTPAVKYISAAAISGNLIKFSGTTIDDSIYTLGSVTTGNSLYMWITGDDTKLFNFVVHPTGNTLTGVSHCFTPNSSLYINCYRPRWVETIVDYNSAFAYLGYDVTDPTSRFNIIQEAQAIAPLTTGMNIYGSDTDLSGAQLYINSDKTGVSAIFPKAGYILKDLYSGVAGYAVSADTFYLTSNAPSALTPITFTISATIYDSATAYVHTVPTIEFLYDPPVSGGEGLLIEVDRRITSGSPMEWLSVRRTLTGQSLRQYIDDPLKPLLWSRTTTSYILSTVTGVSVNALDPKYWVNVAFPISGYPGTHYELTSGYVIIPLWDALTSVTAWYISGYDIVNGIDKMIVQYSSALSFPVSLSARYTDSITPVAVHTFTPYVEPDNLVIEPLAYDNLPFVRSLTAQLMNDSISYGQIPLHPLIEVAWNTNLPYNVTAYDLAGGPVYFNQYVAGDAPVVFKISTSRFTDAGTDTAKLSDFIFYATAKNTYVSPAVIIGTDQYSKTIDTFPAKNLFNVKFNVNEFESSATSSFIHPFNGTLSVTAQDTSIIANISPTTGTRSFTIDGLGTITDSITTFNIGTSGLYAYTLSREGVLGNTWLSAHSDTASMTAFAIDINNAPTARFIAYPSYVWQGVNRIEITDNNLSAVSGVSAYDVTNQEVFHLSAVSAADVVYNWYVDGILQSEFLGPTATYQAPVGILTGSQIKLKLTNNILTLDSPDTYMMGGITYIMPNVLWTSAEDISNPLFQHIRTFPFEVETPVITSWPSTGVLVTPNGLNTIYAAISVTPVNPNTPFVGVSATFLWDLCSNYWLYPGRTLSRIQQRPSDLIFDEDLSYGFAINLRYVPYTVEGNIENLTLSVHSRANVGLPSGYLVLQDSPYDTKVISVTTAPATYILADPIIAVTGTNINVINNTVKLNVFTQFEINNGLSTTNITSAPFDSFTTSYSAEGTYNATVTSSYIDGTSSVKVFEDFVTIISGYTPYDADIKRIYGVTELALPYEYEDIRIAPNEWVVADNINASFKKLTDNITYMDKMLKFYNIPPSQYIGWFGTFNYSGVVNKNIWMLYNEQDGHIYYAPSAGDSGLFTDVVGVAKYNNYYYVADNNTLKIIYNNEVVASTDRTYSNTIFSSLKNVLVDERGRIYVLDGLKVSVFDNYLQTNDWVVYNSWGTYGRTESKYGWYKPNNIVFDADGYIWVVSTGNKALKKYSKVGEWVENINCSSLVEGDDITNGGMIDIAFDINNHVHVLTKDNILIIDRSGSLLQTIDLTPYLIYGTPRHICAMTNDRAFLYITFDNAILKIKEDGLISGVFGDNMGTLGYNGIYQDEHYNLYITDKINIVNFIDMVNITDLSDNNAENYYWGLDDIYVKPNEYSQDWVYGKAFARMWDNIELFRRSIIGKPTYIYVNGKLTIEIVDLDINAYGASIPPPKDELLFGLNELEAADVFNRNVKILVTNQEKILNLIKDE